MIKGSNSVNREVRVGITHVSRFIVAVGDYFYLERLTEFIAIM